MACFVVMPFLLPSGPSTSGRRAYVLVAPPPFVATCWVLDHPAHVRALAPFVREGSTHDMLLLTERAEVRALYEQRDGSLPSRRAAWIPRASGVWSGQRRLRQAVGHVKRWRRSLAGPHRMVAMNAPLMPLAARLAGVPRRWCLVDTEIQHRNLRWLDRGVTDVVVPTHWREDIDGGRLAAWKRGADGGRWNLHRLDGTHQHLHLAPIRRPIDLSDPPRILVRRLLATGSHDDGEVIALPDAVIEGFQVLSWDEVSGPSERLAWSLLNRLSDVDGVVTQSTTFAAEAAYLGVPTLLVSAAERGYLDRVEAEGWPLFRHRGACEGEAWLDVRARWATGMALTDALSPDPWPDAKGALDGLLQDG